jgi:hypothetical protein
VSRYINQPKRDPYPGTPDVKPRDYPLPVPPKPGHVHPWEPEKLPGFEKVPPPERPDL